jgi:pimeloyl-ACP methyl ester carboxylesterase
VIVGYSIGALYARLYAQRHPDEVAGMVIVDHALLDPGTAAPPPKVYPSDQVDTPPVLLSQTPISFELDDDENFARLPQRSRDLHRWATARHPLRPTPELAAECLAMVESATAGRVHPLGDLPLAVVSTPNLSANYGKLQTELLSLSTNSRQVMANRSTHMIIIDQPEAIVAAIREVVGKR